MKLAIFDFDGTLGDTTGIILTTMAATFRAMGRQPLSEAQYRSVIGLPLEKCFSSLIPLDEAGEAEYAAAYRKMFDELDKKGAVTLYPGVLDTMRKLKDDGMKLAIASSRHRHTLDRYIAELGLAPLIEMTVGADDVTKAKPDPQPVNIILDALGVPAAEAAMVGDAPFDILMGRAAGCRTIAVTYGNGTAEDLRAAGADFLADSFT
ncbi:MAG: HAD-IA family hydrolase, partial [Bacteroidales bacterium]|nr:HAD-IA family hydrolase [Bacteroidales bacterium]